jgi:hypothetical protein
MSRGLGRVERAILDLIEEGGCYRAQHLASAIYPAPSARAQLVAIFRAMHSLKRKYPDELALAGGKGRDALWIGTPRDIAGFVANK